METKKRRGTRTWSRKYTAEKNNLLDRAAAKEEQLVVNHRPEKNPSEGGRGGPGRWSLRGESIEENKTIAETTDR